MEGEVFEAVVRNETESKTNCTIANIVALKQEYKAYEYSTTTKSITNESNLLQNESNYLYFLLF